MKRMLLFSYFWKFKHLKNYYFLFIKIAVLIAAIIEYNNSKVKIKKTKLFCGKNKFLNIKLPFVIICEKKTSV